MKRDIERNDCRGFTMLELLISLIILVVLSGAIVLVFNQSQSAFRNQQDLIETTQRLRIAQDQIIRYFRQAGNDPLGVGFQPVQVVSLSEVIISSDVTGSIPSATENAMEKTGDPDGAIDSIYESIRVRFDSNRNEVYIDIGYGEQLLVDDVSNLTFSFFDASGNPTNDPAGITRVRVDMTALGPEHELNVGGRVGSVTLSSGVFIRSRTTSVI